MLPEHIYNYSVITPQLHDRVMEPAGGAAATHAHFATCVQSAETYLFMLGCGWRLLTVWVLLIQKYFEGNCFGPFEVLWHKMFLFFGCCRIDETLDPDAALVQTVGRRPSIAGVGLGFRRSFSHRGSFSLRRASTGPLSVSWANSGENPRRASLLPEVNLEPISNPDPLGDAARGVPPFGAVPAVAAAAPLGSVLLSRCLSPVMEGSNERATPPPTTTTSCC